MIDPDPEVTEFLGFPHEAAFFRRRSVDNGTGLYNSRGCGSLTRWLNAVDRKKVETLCPRMCARSCTAASSDGENRTLTTKAR
jgi:hypothetical protein